MSEASGSELKESVRADWSGRGPAWDRWADDIAAMAERFNQPLLEAADVGPGQHVLDLASGAGEPALSIARRVGATGRVTATDLVPEMLAGARRRSREAGLDNIAFELADMEDLPFPDDSFDRVTCRFGIMFSPHPEIALAESRRVLTPGGKAAYLIWGPRQDTTMFDVMWTTVERLCGPAEEMFTFPPFRFGEAGTLQRMMAAAGYRDTEEIEHRFQGEVPADSPFWRPQLEMSFGPRLATMSEAERTALEQAVAEAFARQSDEEILRLDAHVRVVRGTAAD
jgi:ubiquinone/menaquinone biosynthesis C-methylase UbiE